MRRRMGNTTSKLVMVGLVLVAGFVLRSTYEQIIYPSKSAAAQADQYDCASFGSQASAQVELDSDPSDPNNLDSDGNGIACDNYPYGTSSSVAASTPAPTIVPPDTTSASASPSSNSSASPRPGRHKRAAISSPRAACKRTSAIDGGRRVSGRVPGKTQRPLPRVALQHAPDRALVSNSARSSLRLSLVSKVLH
jgi:hypothetical protein